MTPGSGINSSVRAEVARPQVTARALELASDLSASSARRVDVPVRVGFVERINASAPAATTHDLAPLARLVNSGGRGGGVALKLFLSIVWRCSAAPFTTDISARQWAALLDLPDPAHLGARRVTDALKALERQHLVTLESRRGEPSVIGLLDEHGQGSPYRLPSTSMKAAAKKDRDAHLYFKVPTRLWTHGHLQAMSTPALAMLLICLASERGSYGKPQWWSTEAFPNRYSLSPATRSRGSKELVDRNLLIVTKELVSNSRTSAFGREQVRNRYQLINDAVVTPA